jgi:sortase A
MALYSYVKKKNLRPYLVVRFISYIMITFGFSFFAWAAYPILLFEAQNRFIGYTRVTAPVLDSNPDNVHFSRNILGTSDSLSQNVGTFIQTKDWFPQRPQGAVFEGEMTHDEYWMSIPKLGIHSAKVLAGANDLSKSLIHYLPSTAPGEYGSVNIFGHSTLPQLFDVKDYKSIFTYLPDLVKGDRIFIEYGNQKYEFEVYEMFVVKPEQVSVLEPRFDGSYLTLITCVPPGTYWNRLVVKAKLTHLPFGAEVKAH